MTQMPTYNTALINNLKSAEQDFEFYPTTNEILNAVVNDLKDLSEDRFFCFSSILDIGAGNGKTLMRFHKEFNLEKLYAIEKSTILCQQLDPAIFIIGTDFYEQSLLDKTADITFCNPPYSQYEEWAEKILRQSSSKIIYLVIPERWKYSQRLLDVIQSRDMESKIIGDYDFMDSEDRTARAKVNLIRIESENRKDDAFNMFFEKEFAGLKEKFDNSRKDTESETRKNNKFGALVVGENYPAMLVNMYRDDMQEIERNYRAIGDLNVELLKELGVDLAKIRSCLRGKLTFTKNLYWNELFHRLDSITNCLTSKSRNSILSTLNAHMHVDFTLDNVYAIVIWVLKNANNYLESQLVETYEKMANKCNVYLYKSNQKTWIDDRWRYAKEEKNSHYALEYRIVTHYVGGIHTDYGGRRKLEERGAEFIGDLLTIARNLGFNCVTNAPELDRNYLYSWEPGEKMVFNFTRNEKSGVLMEVKAFLNGNMHIRFDQELMKCLNVEFGRIKGWLKTPAEAASELNDPTVVKYFNVNTHFSLENSPYLLLK